MMLASLEVDAGMGGAGGAGAGSGGGASLTWNALKRNIRLIRSFEDPITGGMVDIAEYSAVYGAVLQQLDGTDLSSFVDFFFTPSPIDVASWRFVDDDARQDFLDWAVELGCVPSLDEVKCGESKDDVKARDGAAVCYTAAAAGTAHAHDHAHAAAGGAAGCSAGAATSAVASPSLAELELAEATREREARLRAARKAEEAARKKAARAAERAKAAKANAGARKHAQLVASLHKLSDALAKEGLTDAKRAKLEGKRARVLAMLEHSTDGC